MLVLFLQEKSELGPKVLQLIKDLCQKGTKVKHVHLNNAGENKKLEELCLKEGLGIKFENTAPGTPQHNGRVERNLPVFMQELEPCWTMQSYHLGLGREYGQQQL